MIIKAVTIYEYIYIYIYIILYMCIYICVCVYVCILYVYMYNPNTPSLLQANGVVMLPGSGSRSDLLAPCTVTNCLGAP